MPRENLHHRGHEGTQRKTTEEIVEKQHRRNERGECQGKTFTTEGTKLHKGKPPRKPRKKLPKKRKSGMPSENLHHRGHEGTQRKTTEETVEKQGKRGMPK